MKKSSYKWVSKGLNRDGKEILDIQFDAISSPKILHHLSLKKEMNRDYFTREGNKVLALDIYGNTSFEPINPEYVENMRKLKERQKEMRVERDRLEELKSTSSKNIFSFLSNWFNKRDKDEDFFKPHNYLEIQELKKNQ